MYPRCAKRCDSISLPIAYVSRWRGWLFRRPSRGTRHALYRCPVHSPVVTRPRTRADTFVLQTGGLGDVVLTARLIDGVKRAAPEQRVLLAIYASLERAPSIFPTPPDEICPLNMR